MAKRGGQLYPFDWAIIGYCLLVVATVVVFGRPLDQYLDELLFYSVVAVGGAVIATRFDSNRGGYQRAVRLLYPALLFPFFYHMTGGLMFVLHGGFLDNQLTGFEQAVLGIEPSLYIDQHLLRTWVTELLSFCYFSYYLMLPAFVITLYLKRQDETIRRSLTAICLTFFASYVLFFLYPIEGPRWHFAQAYQHTITGPLFRPLVDVAINRGAVRGGCMPSSHVGVALVILMYTFRQNRTAGWLLLPLNIGLALGTVWGRFHYVSDVIVGAGIGAVCTLLVWRYYDRWCSQTALVLRKTGLKAEHVT